MRRSGKTFRQWRRRRFRRYLLQFHHHDVAQVPHQAVQVGDEQRLGAVLREVDEGGGGVRLHPRVALVLHRLQQSRDHLGRGGRGLIGCHGVALRDQCGCDHYDNVFVAQLVFKNNLGWWKGKNKVLLQIKTNIY